MSLIRVRTSAGDLRKVVETTHPLAIAMITAFQSRFLAVTVVSLVCARCVAHGTQNGASEAETLCKLLQPGENGFLLKTIQLGLNVQPPGFTIEKWAEFIHNPKPSWSNPTGSHWLYAGDPISSGGTFAVMTDSGLGAGCIPPCANGGINFVDGVPPGIPMTPFSSSWVLFRNELLPFIFPGDVSIAMPFDALASHVLKMYVLDGNTDDRVFGGLPLSYIGAKDVDGVEFDTAVRNNGGYVGTPFNCWAADEPVFGVDGAVPGHDGAVLAVDSEALVARPPPDRVELPSTSVPRALCIRQKDGDLTCGSYIGANGSRYDEYLIMDMNTTTPKLNYADEFQCQFSWEGTSGEFGANNNDFINAVRSLWTKAVDLYNDGRPLGVAPEMVGSPFLETEVTVNLDTTKPSIQKLLDESLIGVFAKTAFIGSDGTNILPEEGSPEGVGFETTNAKTNKEMACLLSKAFSSKLGREIPAYCATTLPFPAGTVAGEHQDVLDLHWPTFETILSQGLTCDTVAGDSGPLIQLLNCDAAEPTCEPIR